MSRSYNKLLTRRFNKSRLIWQNGSGKIQRFHSSINVHRCPRIQTNEGRNSSVRLLVFHIFSKGYRSPICLLHSSRILITSSVDCSGTNPLSFRPSRISPETQSNSFRYLPPPAKISAGPFFLFSFTFSAAWKKGSFTEASSPISFNVSSPQKSAIEAEAMPVIPFGKVISTSSRRSTPPPAFLCTGQPPDIQTGGTDR